MEGQPPSPKRRRTGGADADTARRNAAHFQLVAARLTEQLVDALRLEPALRELAAIALACDEQSVEFAMFEALDELMQTGMERDADLGAVISAEG